MSTNFFQRQAAARHSTAWLLLMFSLATVAIVVTVMVVVGLVTSASADQNAINSIGLALLAGALTLLLIMGGSLFKIAALRAGGGAAVAESMGGVRIYPNTTDHVQRRLLNVVEEMAIASGVPVPPVYYLAQEPGINAFAAGYTTSDAVLGVTQGCAVQLTREELQGVLAHEFSHILNGDMRIGIRVMGVLYGILLMGLVGQFIFRAVAYSSSGRSSRNNRGSNPTLVIMLIGVALIVIGFVGTFLGNLIKAAISRQRERLADASGVQFTRNPAGLAGALKRIGSLQAGSHMRSPGAANASHILFAEGVWKNMAGLWSSHPPLEERIRELDPTWDGTYPASGAADRIIAAELANPDAVHASFAGTAAPREIPTPVVHDAVEQVGNPTQAHVAYAVNLAPVMPSDIVSAVRDPYAARAIVLAMLLNTDERIRKRQFQALQALVTPDLFALVQQFSPSVDRLDARTRLPLVDMAIPALGAMAPAQYAPFIKAFNTLAQADGELDLFEWVLAQIVIRHLKPKFSPSRPPPVRQRPLSQLVSPCEVVFSAVAHAGNSDQKAESAFASAAAIFPELGLQLQSRSKSDLPALRRALDELRQATSQAHGRLVDACATSICTDGHATIEEVELLRGISDLLDCPMPPLLAD